MGLMVDDINLDDMEDEDLIRMGIVRDDTNYKRGLVRAETKAALSRPSWMGGRGPESSGLGSLPATPVAPRTQQQQRGGFLRR